MTDSRFVWEARVNALKESVGETQALATAVVQEHDQHFAAAYPTAQAFAASQQSTEGIGEAYDLLFMREQVQLCRALLSSLDNFLSEATHFFFTKFYNGKETLDDAHDAFVYRYSMRLLLYQAALDLNIVQQAVNQRRSLWQADGYQLSRQGLTLNMADNVMTMALDPLMAAGYLPDTTHVVCYLDKNVRARLVPYDDTLLVRVAATTVQLHDDRVRAGFPAGPSRDLIALLHELGHHLYWNGRLPQTDTPIYEHLAQKAKEVGIYHPREWRLRWLEEIFADAYALMQGGSAVVLDFQEMLTDDLPSHFKEDSDKHPIPELRPLIQTQFLRKLKDESGQPLFTNMPDRLDAHWEALLEKRPLRQHFRVHSRQPATGHHIVQALDGLLDVIAEVLHPLYPAIHAGSVLRRPGMWSKDRLTNNQLGSLYSEFAQSATVSHLEAHSDEMVAALMIKDVDDAVGAFYQARFATTPKSFAQRVEELTGTTPDKARGNSWIDTFLMRGWSTEGPEGDPIGKG